MSIYPMKTVHHDMRIAISGIWWDIGGDMKKWGADFKIPEVVLRDYHKQPIIVDFSLVLAMRLIERYKYS